MPYADSLYSANESDADSFSDELTPTDGYFEQRNHPQDLMVPNIPVDENESSAESKAKEARAETPSDSHDITSYRAASPHLQPSQPSLSQTSPSPSASAAPAPSSTSSSSPKIRHPKPQPRTPSIPTPSPLLHSRSSSRQHSLSEDPEPLRPYDQPPPAYSPPLSQISSISVNEPANYSTISIPQLEEGRVPYQRYREPESMGSPRDTNDESTPLFRRSQYRTSHRLSCRRLLLLLAFLGLVVISVVIGVTSHKSSSNQKNGNTPGGTPHKTPKNEEGDGQNNPIFDQPVVSNGPYCNSAIYHVDASPAQYALDSNNALRIYQIFDDDREDSHGGYHVETAGEIHVRKAPDGIKEAYLTTDFYVSDRSLEPYITQKKEDGYLEVKSVQYGPVGTIVQSCISIEITVWLPDYSQIANLDIGATTLNIRVFDDAKAYVANSSTIGTVSGSITFPGDKPGTGHRSFVRSRGLQLPKLPKLPSLVDIIPKLPEYFQDPPKPNNPSSPTPPKRSKNIESSPEPSPHTFSSRDTRIETISGHISGTFQQYDSLYLSTKSGNINAYIEPHAVFKSDPKPALLDVRTISGQINARYDVRDGSDLPLRNYQTDVDTTSGTITGDFIIGSQLYVKTYSGTINVSALPFGILGKDHAEFRTTTTSGGTDVLVLDPIYSTAHEASDDDPYNIIVRSSYISLRSHHVSTSGHLHVRLPQAFEGRIEGTSISGGIRVVGDGVRIIRDDSRNWVSKKVVAVKGEGDVKDYGDVKVDGISGSLDIEVGRVL